MLKLKNLIVEANEDRLWHLYRVGEPGINTLAIVAASDEAIAYKKAKVGPHRVGIESISPAKMKQIESNIKKKIKELQDAQKKISLF